MSIRSVNPSMIPVKSSTSINFPIPGIFSKNFMSDSNASLQSTVARPSLILFNIAIGSNFSASPSANEIAAFINETDSFIASASSFP